MRKNKFINLIAVLNTIHSHLREFRAYPNLRRGKHQISFNQLIRRLFELVPHSSTFERRELKLWERQRTLRYSIPDIEKKAINLFEKAMPHTRGYQLSKIDRITPDEVYTADKATMSRYRKDKTFDLLNISNRILAKSVDHIESNLYVGECEMKEFKEACDSLTQNTSSCYPLYQKKSSLDVRKDAAIKLEKLQNCDNLLDMLNLLNTQVITVFHRFTTKLKRADGKVLKDTKIRQVFGQPYFLMVLESMMFGSALDKITRKNLNGYFSYALTRPEISYQVKHLRNTAKRTNRKIVCSDVTQIDSNITPYTIYLVLTFLASHFNYSTFWVNVYTVYIIWFIFTPVIWASRRLDWMVGGHLTGSLPTSFVNSYAVLLALTYYKLYYERRLIKPEEVKILGDDFIVLINDESNLDNLRKVFKLFNLTMHPSKTEIINPSENITYLGFQWDENNEPNAIDLWYIARICFPEKFIKVRGTERITHRAASILYQIKGGHKIFELVFVTQLRYLKEMIERGFDPIIEYFDKSGGLFYIRIAYSKLKILGWRAY